MKKTLTSLTLSSIAAVAVANPIPKNDTAPSSNSVSNTISNVNINIPTGGAKPLAKIESSQSVIQDKDLDNSKKKNQELDVLPLPTNNTSSNNSSKAISSPVISVKPTTVVPASSNVKNLKETKKTKTTVEKHSNNIIKSENKSEIVQPTTSVTTSSVSLSSKENPSKENFVKEPVEITSPVISTPSINPISTTDPVVSKTVSPETKDVKTEVTLEKKEIINKVQKVNKIIPTSNTTPVVLIKPEIKEEIKEENVDVDVVKDSTELNNKTDLNNVDTQSSAVVSPNVDKNKSLKNDTKEKSKQIKKKTSIKKVNVVPAVSPVKSIQNSTPNSVKTINFTKEPAAYVMSSKDIKLDVLYNSMSNEYLVKFEHKNGIDFRTSDFANALQAEGKISASTPILFSLVNSKLDTIEIIKSSVNPEGEYLFKLPQSQGKCEAFYVTYKLANDIASSTKSIILDSNGNPSSEMDRNCSTPKAITKDDVSYTKNKYIVSTNWNNIQPNIHKTVIFSSIISKEGEDILTSSLRYIIVSEDFKNFYYSVGVNNNSPILGTVFSQPIHSSGMHFFTAVFDNDKGGFDLSTSKKYINE